MPRLDAYLLEHHFCRSRSLGARLVREGYVYVNGVQCHKPSTPVTEEDQISIQESPLTRYVSRGGLKLEGALREWGIPVQGALCADIGASTGGFTDCLLQHGAARVWAVDSGSDQLHPALKENEFVVSMENVNARFLDESQIPPVDLVVMDVSFISQTLIYPAVAKILKEGGIFLSLVKPQFEVGREEIGGGGIVRSEKARLGALEKIKTAGQKHGFSLEGTMLSPITGGDGNVEYLAYFKKI